MGNVLLRYVLDERVCRIDRDYLFLGLECVGVFWMDSLRVTGEEAKILWISNKFRQIRKGKLRQIRQLIQDKIIWDEF